MGKRKENEIDLSMLQGRHYSKSNALVNAKNNASLFAQKLVAIGLQQITEDEKTGILSTTLYGTDLRKIFGNKSGSFYDEIKELVDPKDNKHASIMDWKVIYTDDVKKSLVAVNIIMDCTFENGVLEMRFNNKVNDQIYMLKQNYTVYALEEAIPLKSKYSFRLYEILKSEYDRQRYLDEKNGGHPDDSSRYITEINITDLKLRLGIIDASPEIQNALKAASPDYDSIEKMAQDQKDSKSYQRYNNLKQKALVVAQKELKEKTSICFDFQEIKNGRGAKCVGVRFTIWKNLGDDIVVEDVKRELTEEEKEAVIDKVFNLIDEKLVFKDYRAICEAANYSYEKVKKQYENIQNKKTQINDLTAYLIGAIKGNYSSPVKKSRKSTFKDFEQQTIDFDALEKKILDN